MATGILVSWKRRNELLMRANSLHWSVTTRVAWTSVARTRAWALGNVLANINCEVTVVAKASVDRGALTREEGVGVRRGGGHEKDVKKTEKS